MSTLTPLSIAVLDTSVFSLYFSHFHRLSPPQQEYLAFIDSLKVGCLPVQVLAEVLYGAERRNWGPQRHKEIFTVASRFLICEATAEVAVSWATLTAHAEQAGRTLHSGDAWVAACAVDLGVPLLHHDADFERLGFPGLKTMTLLETP